jgi:hypothetical protein
MSLILKTAFWVDAFYNISSSLLPLSGVGIMFIACWESLGFKLSRLQSKWVDIFQEFFKKKVLVTSPGSFPPTIDAS